MVKLLGLIMIFVGNDEILYTVHGNLPMHYPDFRTTPVHLSDQHKELTWSTKGTVRQSLTYTN